MDEKKINDYENVWVNYKHEKNILKFSIPLSQIHSWKRNKGLWFCLSDLHDWKEYFIFSSPSKWNTCMKNKFRALIMFEWITCMKRIFFILFLDWVSNMHEKNI